MLADPNDESPANVDAAVKNNLNNAIKIFQNFHFFRKCGGKIIPILKKKSLNAFEKVKKWLLINIHKNSKKLQNKFKLQQNEFASVLFFFLFEKISTEC